MNAQEQRYDPCLHCAGFEANDHRDTTRTGSVKLLTPIAVILRIALIMTMAEILIMLGLQIFPFERDPYSGIFLNAALLALVSTPAIYLWVIKPFVKARDGALAHIGTLAFTDPLTQLPNRRLISEHLHRIIASAVRHSEFGAVLMIDLDDFKLVNDKHGHQTGDAVLVEIASRLRYVVRSEDVVGRLGGDEFIVLVHQVDHNETQTRAAVSQLAETLIDTIKLPIELDGKTFQVGASIGIRLLGVDRLDPHTAISQADRAMYSVKEVKGHRVAFFKP